MLKAVSSVLAAALMLSGIAVYNGYPLVFADTGDYLRPEENQLRSFFYDLFLYPAVRTGTLWPVVLVQSLIMAHLLRLVLRTVFQSTSEIPFLAIAAFLSLATSLPWFTGFIMPDIFTGALILTLSLLAFFEDRLGRAEKGYLFALTVLATTTHLSHPPLALGFLFCVWILKLSNRKRALWQAARIRTAGLALSLALALLLAGGFGTQGSRSFFRGIYAYALARLIADGPAVLYLREHCSEERYALCSYVNELPRQSHQFLWSPDSPFRKVGSIEGYRTEGEAIVLGTVLHHPGLVLRDSLQNAARQLPMINNWYGICSYLHLPYPTEEIRARLPGDFEAYASSRQSRETLGLDRFNLVDKDVVAVSLAVALLSCGFFLGRKEHLPVLLFFSICGAYLLSALVTAAFSEPHNRYGSRIVWLFPFFSAASLVAIGRRWRSRENTSARSGAGPGEPSVRPRRILITGAAGQVGSLIRPLLARAYPEIRLTDRVPAAPLADNEEFLLADLGDRESLARALGGVDGVVHLAAVSGESPFAELFASNVEGVANLLEAACQCGVRRVVLASTMHVLGYSRLDERVVPETRPRPDSRYAVTKLFGEDLGRFYADRHGLSVCCLRIGHVTARREEAEPGNWISPEDLVSLIRIGLEHPDLAYEIFPAVALYDGDDLGQREAQGRFGWRCLHPGGRFSDARRALDRLFPEGSPARDRRGRWALFADGKGD